MLNGSNEEKTKKIYIPVEEYPNYNFIGLIIGPRGMTLKRMEQETECKISIRGGHGATDNLHVELTGTDLQIDKASAKIHELLVPIEAKKVCTPLPPPNTELSSEYERFLKELRKIMCKS